MDSYDTIRRQYQPKHISFLIIAESPPPAAHIQSSRHFYRAEKIRQDDRLFTNTIRALYPEAADAPELTLEQNKERWLRTFQKDGWYMIEALQQSQQHNVTKQQRQQLIRENIPQIIKRVSKLASPSTKIILIKSNVYDVAAEPLRAAGFNVLNTELVDYPGRFNQQAYRAKLAALAKIGAAHHNPVENEG